MNLIGFEKFIPGSLKRIVRKACHPDPAKRFSSAAELRKRLDSLRFDVDWICLANNEWQGYCENKMHRCVVDVNSCELTITVNDRKVSALCKSFTSPSEVMDHMRQYIADTGMR